MDQKTCCSFRNESKQNQPNETNQKKPNQPKPNQTKQNQNNWNPRYVVAFFSIAQIIKIKASHKVLMFFS